MMISEHFYSNGLVRKMYRNQKKLILKVRSFLPAYRRRLFRNQVHTIYFIYDLVLIIVVYCLLSHTEAIDKIYLVISTKIPLHIALSYGITFVLYLRSLSSIVINHFDELLNVF